LSNTQLQPKLTGFPLLLLHRQHNHSLQNSQAMTTIQKKSLSVGKYVDTNHVNAVIRNYKQERWAQSTSRLGKEDSRSVWFSIEELEGFIEKVKGHGGDGIRFYFSVLPHDYTEVPEYAGRQNLVLVASKTKETATGTKNKDLYINTKEGAQMLAYGDGAACPPFFCTGDTDGWGDIGITIIDRGDEGMVVV